MNNELSPDERRLSEVLDELPAPPSVSYLPREGLAEVNRVSAPHRWRAWHDGVGGVLVGLAVFGIIAGGYFGLRNVRPSHEPASTGWRVVASPPAMILNSVACPSAGGCWAVGAAIEHETAHGWTIATSPTPVGATLRGVACPTAGDCWAVGNVAGMYSSGPLVESYSDGAWAIVSGPWVGEAATSGRFATFSAVACPDAVHCWAVGSIATEGGSSPKPIIASSTGTGWNMDTAPSIAGSTAGSLSAIACPGISDCWAVGAADDHVLIEHYTASGWAVVAAPAGPPAATLNGVKCPAVDDCWAVGSSGSGDTLQPLIEHYMTGIWVVATSSRIAVSGGAELESVACLSPSACWAVGDYPGAGSFLDGTPRSGNSDSSTYATPLIESYSRNAWSVSGAPALAGRPGAFTAVDCGSGVGCSTVGTLAAQAP